MAEQIETRKESVTAAVLASRGCRSDQSLAVIPQDLPNTFTDIAASTCWPTS
jgi:5'-nucleotidase